MKLTIRKLGFVLLLLAVALPLIASASIPSQQEADADQCQLVYLFDAWARATVPGAPNSAAYGLLVNLGAEEDTLISASTDVAEAVELHEMVMGDGDVMQMRPVEGGLTVAARQFMALAPGGLHIMLINLAAPLEAGTSFDLTLNFEHAASVTLSIPVRDMAEMDMAEMGGDGEGDMTYDMGDEMDEAMVMGEMTTPEWDEACVGLHVIGAWARPTVPGAPTGAAYALIVNLTDADETLLSVSTDAAEVSEIHEMIMAEGDVMRMNPFEGGLTIPAGGAVLLQPGGLHVMLMNLTDALEVGEVLDFTLTFANAGEVEVSIPVHDPDAEGMGEM